MATATGRGHVSDYKVATLAAEVKRSAQQAQLRASARAQRLEEHRQFKTDAAASRQRAQDLRQTQIAQKAADRSLLDDARNRTTQIRRDAGARRLDEQRQLNAKDEAARALSVDLRQEKTEQQALVRKARNERQTRNGELRKGLAAQRIAEHRQLRAVAQAEAEQATGLRARESQRRSQDRKPAAIPSARPKRVLTRTSALAASGGPPMPGPLEGMSWLRTADGFVLDENGRGVSLRGVTVQGLDTVAPAPNQLLAEALSLDATNLSILTNLWGINFVRFPFQAQTLLAGSSSVSADDLLSGLDDTIASLADLNLYTLLALQAPAPNGASASGLPAQIVFDCWTLLAQHYQEEPAALFEVYASALPVASDWLTAAQRLIGAIRSQHPASLLFVGNGAGGADTSNLPLRFSTGEPTPNLVYTIRVAPDRQMSMAEENLLAGLTAAFPVVATDWSASADSELARSAEGAASIFGRYSIGWAAANWNADPRLVVNATAHDFAATRWGSAVQRAMLLPAKQPFTPLLRGESE
jgi:hypothetical protein